MQDRTEPFDLPARTRTIRLVRFIGNLQLADWFSIRFCQAIVGRQLSATATTTDELCNRLLCVLVRISGARMDRANGLTVGLLLHPRLPDMSAIGRAMQRMAAVNGDAADGKLLPFQCHRLAPVVRLWERSWQRQRGAGRAAGRRLPQPQAGCGMGSSGCDSCLQVMEKRLNLAELEERERMLRAEMLAAQRRTAAEAARRSAERARAVAAARAVAQRTLEAEERAREEARRPAQALKLALARARAKGGRR